MADDLIDEPPDGLDASTWIRRLTKHLDLVYKSKGTMTPSVQTDAVRTYTESEFPASATSALTLLPTALLPPEPLYRLLEGFKTDSKFQPRSKPRQFPITNEDRLHEYGSQVAGTVGQLCLALISHHSREPINPARREEIATAAGRMGIALQYVNIARDIAVDTTLGRVYLPTTWLADEGLEPELVIETILGSPTAPSSPSPQAEKNKQDTLAKLVRLRKMLLDKAFAMYAEARPSMDWLPDESRRPMIVAVESYMEIGRVLLEKDKVLVGGVAEGDRPKRATVSKLRRLKVALRALLYA